MPTQAVKAVGSRARFKNTKLAQGTRHVMKSEASKFEQTPAMAYGTAQHE